MKGKSKQKASAPHSLAPRKTTESIAGSVGSSQVRQYPNPITKTDELKLSGYAIPAEWYSHDLFQKAHQSALPHALKWCDSLRAVPRLPLDEPNTFNESVAITSFYAGDGKWLRLCAHQIKKKADEGNEDFFEELGEMISRRAEIRKGLSGMWSPLRQPGDPIPEPPARMIANFIAVRWVEWPLWLMPDPTACSYFCRFTKLKLSLPNFTKWRQRLGLFQHPDHPATTYNILDGKPSFRRK